MAAFLCITESDEEINAIKHIYCEVNLAANFLASHVQHFSFSYHCLDAPPTAL